MSLVNDARRMAAIAPDGHTYISSACLFCQAPIEWGSSPHAPDCPWLAVPRIAAALEAAERLTGKRPSCYYGAPDEDDEPVTYFDTAPSCYAFCHGSSEHKPDCPWQALVSALKGGE